MKIIDDYKRAIDVVPELLHSTFENHGLVGTDKEKRQIAMYRSITLSWLVRQRRGKVVIDFYGAGYSVGLLDENSVELGLGFGDTIDEALAEAVLELELSK